MNSVACTYKPFTVGLVLTLTVLTADRLHAENFGLKNRPAAIVIPLIKPLLSNGEAVSGSGQTLTLNASAQRGRELGQLVRSLDQPLQLLELTVYSGITPPAVRLAQTGAGKKVYSTHARPANNHPPLHASVLEGNEVYIERDRSVPLVEQAVIIDDVQTLTRNSVDYEHRRDGFSALPLLRGNKVYLRITTARSRPDRRDGGAWSTTTVSTTVTGKLGEWIQLSGIYQRGNPPNNSAREIRGRTRPRDPDQVWVRVDTALSAVQP